MTKIKIKLEDLERFDTKLRFVEENQARAAIKIAELRRVYENECLFRHAVCPCCLRDLLYCQKSTCPNKTLCKMCKRCFGCEAAKERARKLGKYHE